MLFTSSRYERSLERMMKSVPNFTPRGYGVIIMCHYKQNADSCRCRDCTEWSGSRCGRTACPYFIERMDAGGVSFSELMQAVFADVKNNLFRRRLNNMIRESRCEPMLYRGSDHKDLFEKALKERVFKSPAFLAALYLLTADNVLWQRVKTCVSESAIRFDSARLCGISPAAYTLFMTAKDLYCGSKHITFTDLADRELIGHRMFSVICNAMAFRRYGLRAFYIAERNGERR